MLSIITHRRRRAIRLPRARLSRPARFTARLEVPPEALLLARFPAMPGAALQSVPASALFAVRCVAAQRAAQAPVIDDNSGNSLKPAGPEV
jgi:hypothetical protein